MFSGFMSRWHDVLRVAAASPWPVWIRMLKQSLDRLRLHDQIVECGSVEELHATCRSGRNGQLAEVFDRDDVAVA